MKFSELNLLSIGNTIQMAGAVFSGEGKTFLCFFPGEAEGLESFDDFYPLEMDRAEWETFLRQTDVMETEVIGRAKDGTLAKVMLRKSARQVDQHVSWAVFRRDGYACRYCGKADVPLTVDHLVTWEDGGPSTEANMVSSCKKCNKTRGNLPYAEWLGHPRYAAQAAGLPEDVRRANEDVALTLAAIPRKAHVASR